MRKLLHLALLSVTLFFATPVIWISYINIYSSNPQEIQGSLLTRKFDGEEFLQIRNGSLHEISFQIACQRFGYSQKFPATMKPNETLDINTEFGWSKGFLPGDECHIKYPALFGRFEEVLRLKRPKDFLESTIIKTNFIALIKEEFKKLKQ